MDSFPPGRTEPRALVEAGLLTQAQLDELLADLSAAADATGSRPLPETAQGGPGPAPAGAGMGGLVGETLGDFQIVALLGRGGMGAVYKARQASLSRFVALKVLPEALAGDEIHRERFHREARAAAALNHPNIVQVHAVGEDKGYHYIAMELVDGESLATRLRREGRVGPPQVVQWMREVADALAAAHALGIVHRDIKPGNILLTSRGQAKVADFGLAKQPGVDPTVTSTGMVLATPLYFPPEGARGQKLDARSDLYSLGATFYQALAGRPPFDGETLMELMAQHLGVEPPPLAELAADTPPPLCEIIHRLLRKNPEERFSDACELVEALARIGGAGWSHSGH